jgi:hypothetical protein
MYLMSEYLKNGDMMEKNLAAAYQYKYAIFRSGAGSSSLNAEITQLESQLTPEQVKTAQDNAQAFLARCCQGGAHK